MASWRVKGYVSDSEEDFEDTDQLIRQGASVAADGRSATKDELFGRHLSASGGTDGIVEDGEPVADVVEQHHGLSLNVSAVATGNDGAKKALSQTTTAARLEHSLAAGLSIVRGALSVSPPPKSPLIDQDDSPLSSPPDSPGLPSQTTAGNAANKNFSARFPSSPQVSPPQEITTYAPQRTLRQRNAIQQHPYSVELGRYLKNCNDLGIKPVVMPRATSPSRVRKAAERHDSQFEEESQGQDSYDRESMEIDSAGGQDLPPSSPSSGFAVDLNEDGLPDLQALLHKQMSWKAKYHAQGPAASKQVREPRTDKNNIYDLTSDEDTPATTNVPRRKARSNVLPDSFPSPPRSMSTESVTMLANVEVPSPDHSQEALPTPVLSSEPRARKRRVVEDDTQPGHDTEPVQTISSSEEGSSSEVESNVPDVRLMQKRVKGVLPASWWSVDKAHQLLNTTKKNADYASSRRSETGVAQRKTTTPGRGRTLPFPSTLYDDLVSDEESEEQEEGTSGEGRVLTSPISQLPRRAAGHDDKESIEAVHDEGFDPMLPTRSRARKGQRKKQANLGGYVRHGDADGLQRRSFATTVHRRITSHRPTRKRHKQSVNSDPIHILDAPDLQDRSPRSQPRFLRLAARQGQRQKSASTSASRKFIQLDAEDDGARVLDSFKVWKDARRQNPRQLFRPDEGQPRLSSVRRTTRPRSAQSRTGRQYPAREHPDEDVDMPDALENDAWDPAGVAVPTWRQEARLEQAEVDHFIRCGSPETEQHALRLTRLRTLLPLANRSGRGHLAMQQPQPRTAQLEILRLERRSISRLLPSRMHHPARPSTLQERSINLPNPAVQRYGPNPESTPIPRAKKQIPTYRRNYRQITIAHSAPDTQALEELLGQTGSAVRSILEKEFAAHQAAWFQGSSSGITVSSQQTQTHYQVFLDVLRSYLPAAIQDSEDGREARELRSFVNRLIPNRGQIGAQGQVGNKLLEVYEYDIIVARNVFDLFTTLLNLAPGYGPRPRVLEMKVNFSDAHHEICAIALSAWQDIFSLHHSDHSIIDGLASWLHSMLSQAIDRWQSAESGARRDAALSMRRIDEQLIRIVIEQNRGQACALIGRVLFAFEYGITKATTIAEADALLGMSRYHDTIMTFLRLAEVDEKIVEQALGVSLVYLKQQWHLQNSNAITTILANLRQALTTVTSVRTACSSNLLHAMANAYFTTARTAVAQRQRSWDQFFEPRSSYSLDMFVDERCMDVIKSFFYHELLEHDSTQYCLELRAPVMDLWLRTLLQERSDKAAVGHLTSSLFKHEKESLGMPALSALFQPPNESSSVSKLQEALPEIRHATVMHVISNLHAQEDNSEADLLPGGLEEDDAIRLLRTIFTAMKETWMSLAEQPEGQDIYTVLVHNALEQYQRYPRMDFVVDPWFFNSATFPQPRKQTLAKLLTTETTPEEDFIFEVTEAFDQELAHARRYDRLDNLGTELQHLLLPIDFDAISEQTQFTEILLRHAQFVQAVLVELLDNTREDWYGVRKMVLGVLIHVLKNLECRIDTLDQATTEPFIKAFLPILSRLTALLTTDITLERQEVYRLAGLIFNWAASTLQDLSEGFMDDMEAICDFAGKEEDLAEATQLLESVMLRC